MERTPNPRFSVGNITTTGRTTGPLFTFDLSLADLRITSCKYIMPHSRIAYITGPAVRDDAGPSGWREVAILNPALRQAVLAEVESQISAANPRTNNEMAS